MAGAPQTSPREDACPRPYAPEALTVQTIVSTRWSQDCYLVEDRSARRALVIDPGHGCGEPVAARLDASRSRLDYIVLTHEHHDHIADVSELRARFDATVIAAGAASRHLADPKANLSAFYPGAACRTGPADILAEELGGVLRWGEHVVELHATPGHTEGSICIALPGLLFAGDTLIPGTKTVVKLPRGDKAALARSMDFIFSSFLPDTIVYPGHGAPFPLSATVRTIHAAP